MTTQQRHKVPALYTVTSPPPVARHAQTAVMTAPQPAPREATDQLRLLCAALVIIVAVGVFAFLNVLAVKDGVAVVAAGWSFIIGALAAFFALILGLNRLR